MEQPDLKTLVDMLSFKRPHLSPTEKYFREKFILPLGVTEDKHGNLWKIVGKEKPTVLWSAHTDSVHRTEGRQRLHVAQGCIKLHSKSTSNCLGADDAAGCWILMNMIHAKVPGLYVFHAGEERGGLGSHAIAKDNPEFLDGIKAAIAFDRRATHSVITHQGSRTCSDAFGKSLMAQLDGYELDDTGSFTDTKSYYKIVPECTNLSVGYYNEHSANERLDYIHICKLRDMMLKIDPSQFAVERDPKVDDPLDRPSWKGQSWRYGYTTASNLGSGATSNYPSTKTQTATTEKVATEAPKLGSGTAYYQEFNRSEIERILWRYPKDAAIVIEDLGFDASEFEDLVQTARVDRLSEERDASITLDDLFPNYS